MHYLHNCPSYKVPYVLLICELADKLATTVQSKCFHKTGAPGSATNQTSQYPVADSEINLGIG